jgi:hypothetical protein
VFIWNKWMDGYWFNANGTWNDGGRFWAFQNRLYLFHFTG